MSAARTLVSRSPEETQAIGEQLGARLTRGAVVACTGELGAGKTCFLQGLARGLGVTADVTSPTFVLVNQYRGRLPVYHLDAYRTGSLTELVDLGLEEMLHGEIHVHLSGLGDEPREIQIVEPVSDPSPRI